MGILMNLLKKKSQRLPLKDRIGAVIIYFMTGFALLMLVLPMFIVIAVSFGTDRILRFPPTGFSLQNYYRILESQPIMTGFRVSLIVAIITIIINLILSIPASIAIVRKDFPGKAFVMGFIQSPMMIPGIVIGISILFFLSYFGFQLSIPMLILAHVVITIPYVFRLTTARMESADPALEDAARNLGANSIKVFWYILLPYLKPGIIGGAVFAFLLSFDDLPVSLFTAPIIQRPLPVEMFHILMWDLDPIVSAVATLQISVTLIVLIVIARSAGVKMLINKDN